ncbi:MAG: hypothetical protein ABI876_06660 [Bacteroidota bacterium]
MIAKDRIINAADSEKPRTEDDKEMIVCSATITPPSTENFRAVEGCNAITMNYENRGGNIRRNISSARHAAGRMAALRGPEFSGLAERS